jgi:hypothetical protein
MELSNRIVPVTDKTWVIKKRNLTHLSTGIYRLDGISNAI